ncbi:hypothetical protein F4820DRAFT_462474 [Hypoxylon rubiginosum]|uniref:Uncharacterized protein n=1 Tax=Hypoxylon rubiginosum TaxID=110542 RepID=A0ACB9YKJ9_9PEZI|nr:hypothetical protein F4820DRAFT_462474 [Hypoxylon rubiginosum]
MDPASIFQIVGTAISISEVVFRCINRLSVLKDKYQDAPMLLSTLIGQLYIIQAALDQLSAWNSQDLDRDPRYRHLALQMENSLDPFSPLIFTLQQQLDRHDSTEMTTKGKLLFLWSENEMTNYSVLLDRTTWAQQRDMIDREENQSIIKLAKDCSSSIVGQNEASSYISENSAAISTTFDFDTILFSSTLYQQAQRSHLRQAIRATRNQTTELPLAQLRARRTNTMKQM